MKPENGIADSTQSGATIAGNDALHADSSERNVLQKQSGPVEPLGPVCPVVPRTGHLFTSDDIDDLLDRMQRGENFVVADNSGLHSAAGGAGVSELPSSVQCG